MNKNNFSKFLISFLLFPIFFTLAIDSEEPKNDFYIVEVPIEEPIQNITAHKSESIEMLAGDKTAIFHIPTITKKTDFSSSRGLGYNRLNFENLDLLDPLSSFLLATKNLQNYASSLNISLPISNKKEINARFGYGLYHLFKLANSINVPLDENSSLFMASSIDSHNANFAFEDENLGKKIQLEKRNNDQHMIKTIAQYSRQTTDQKILARAMANMHEGGIEGFSFRQLNIRSNAINAGINAEVTQKIKETEFFINTSHGVFENYTSINLTKDSDFIQTSHEVIAGFKPLNFPKFLSMNFAQKIVIEKAYKKNKTRLGLGLLMDRKFNFGENASLNANFDMTGYHEEALLFNKNLTFAMILNNYMDLNVTYLKTSRTASLLELYGKNAFFKGNKKLKPESIYGLSVGSNIKAHKTTDLHITTFFDYLGESIAYQPYLGAKITPKNSSHAIKFGFDAGLDFRPLELVKLSTNNEFIAISKVMSNKNPLPQTPFLSGITKILIGQENFLHLTLQTRYKTSSFFDFDKRLKLNPYMLIDSIATYEMNEKIGFSLMVENIFNEKGAKNALYMPIQGTTFFGQIQINNI